MTRNLLSLLVVAVMSSPSLAAPRVEVKVDRTTMTMDDELRMTVSCEGSFERIVEPPTPGFEQISRSQSEQIQIAGGRMTKSKRLDIRLRPVRSGVHTIGAARLTVATRDVAVSKPIPLVAPVTSATWPTSSRSVLPMVIQLLPL